MREKIVGREAECEKLQNCLNSNTSQLVIVYGRRRVGKTFLINQFFNDDFAFKVTGIFNKPKRMQLQAFCAAINNYFNDNIKTPDNWISAFGILRKKLSDYPKNKKMVLFFDEFPWFDTHKSDFLPAFEWFWNDWGCAQDNIICIVCGSATSWMVEHIDHNKGGLFNRQNLRLYLEPFNLYETKEFLKKKNIDWSEYDIAECYMIMGGIPFYLSQLSNQYSLNRNIDELFFKKHSALWDEFEHLYNTLFVNGEQYIKIVEILSSKKIGLTRYEISEKSGLSANGNLSKILDNLVNSGFVRSYPFYGNKKKQMLYQLCDYYTLFYFRFLKENYGKDENFWSNSYDYPSRKVWAGFTFEQLCRDHVRQIKQKLSIGGILSSESAWLVKGDKENDGAQIDMIIDRRDRVLNICEMKFSNDKFEIDKDYDLSLRRKINRFVEETGTKKTIQLTFVTTCGVKQNMYSNRISNQVLLEDLFKKREGL